MPSGGHEQPSLVMKNGRGWARGALRFNPLFIDGETEAKRPRVTRGALTGQGHPGRRAAPDHQDVGRQSCFESL